MFYLIRKTLFCMILALIGRTMAFAEDSLQVISKGEEIFLQAAECDILERQGLALIDWTLGLEVGELRDKEKRNSKAIPKCQCVSVASSRSCSMAVSSLLSTQVLNLLKMDKKGIGLGPNCWNAALLSAGVLPTRRYVSDGEFHSYLNSPFCARIEDSKDLRPGDVMAIQWVTKRDSNEIHAFNFVSSELAFTKNGSTPFSPYQITPMERIFEIYSLPPHCRGPIGNDQDPNKGKDCPQTLKAYRCLPLSSIEKDSWSDSGRKIFEELEGLERVMEKLSEHHFEFKMNHSWPLVRDKLRMIQQRLGRKEKKARWPWPKLFASSCDSVPDQSGDEILWPLLTEKVDSLLHSGQMSLGN